MKTHNISQRFFVHTERLPRTPSLVFVIRVWMRPAPGAEVRVGKFRVVILSRLEFMRLRAEWACQTEFVELPQFREADKSE